MFGYDPLEVLPEFPSPLLVAAAESGSADDEVARERLLALEEVVRARSGRGGPTRVVRYQSGHNVMRYRPGELAAELLGLLELAATSGDTPGAPA